LETNKPLRVKIILVSAFLSCAIVILYVVSVGYMITVDSRNFLTSLITTLIFSPFLIHGFLLIFAIRRYYPAGDISKPYLILKHIIIPLVILLIVFIILGLVGIMLSDKLNLNDAMPGTPGKIVMITFIFLMLSQFHLLFEGYWLVKKIRINYRNSLLNNW
jgi:hypothetical protein